MSYMSGATDIAGPFVQQFESCALTAYKDQVGVWTIGYGHTGPEVKEGLVWTPAQAAAALKVDLTKAETAARRAISVQLSDKQLAALISMVFNIGPGCLNNTTLQAVLNQRNWLQAAKEMIRWDHAGGTEVKGLLIRRFVEGELFLRGS